ncbi:MAG: hypothetical protein ACREFY_17920 [Acetobacteraceae bacterium]
MRTIGDHCGVRGLGLGGSDAGGGVPVGAVFVFGPTPAFWMEAWCDTPLRAFAGVPRVIAALAILLMWPAEVVLAGIQYRHRSLEMRR